MKDSAKAKGQLVSELTAMRQRVAELEAAETRHTQAEEALRQSEETHRLFIENASDVFYSLAPDLRVISVSPGVERLLGYRPEELIGRPFPELGVLAPESLEQAISDTLRVLGGESVSASEYQFISKDGTQGFGEVSGAPLFADDGTVVAVLSVARDVTERKQVEEALRLSEERYRFLYEESGGVSLIIGMDGRIIDVNRAALEKFGYSREQDQGTYALDIVVPEHRGKAADVLANALKGQHTPEMDIDVYAKDGSIRSVSLLPGHMPLYEQGQPTGILVTGLDITERKQAEEALRESEERFRVASQLATDLVYERDMETGVATYYGDIDSRMGYGPGEYPRTLEGAAEHIHPEDLRKFFELDVDEFNAGKPVSVEYRRRKQDGTCSYWLDHFALVRDRETGRPEKLIGVASDVTERKETEDALRASEERYRILVNNSNDLVASADLEGNLLFANPSSRKFTGHEPEEVVGRNFAEFVHRDDVPALLAAMQEALRAGSPEDVIAAGLEPEFRLVRKDGGVIWARSKGLPYKSKEGETVGFTSITRDVTERKQAEQALRESEERFRFVLDNSLDVLYRFSLLSGKYDYMSPASADVLGYTPEQWMARGFDAAGTLVHQDDIHSLADNVAKLIMGAEEVSPTCEYRLKHGELGYRWMADTRSVVYDNDNKPVAVVGSLRDVTEQKEAEEALRTYSERLEELVEERSGQLRDSEERMRSLVENSPDYIMIVDQDATIQFMNRTVSGLTVEQLVGRSAYDYTQPEYRDDFGDAIAQALHTGQTASFISRAVGPESSVAWYENRVAPIRRNGEAVSLMVISTDITERRRLEEELVHKERLALLGQLAAGVGHELRTPLGSVKNAAYFLRTALKRPEPDVMETLEILDTEVAASERIIGSLLDFSRRRTPVRHEVDIDRLVRDSLAHIDVPDEIKVSIEMGATVPALLADPDQLAQAFGNVILNAVQAMPQGGLLTVRCERTSPGCIAVSITDTGVGMSGDTLEEVFEPLFTTKAKGIGLGLALAKIHVEAHGGTIDAKSEVGKGSTFTVTLPLGSQQ